MVLGDDINDWVSDWYGEGDFMSTPGPGNRYQGALRDFSPCGDPFFVRNAANTDRGKVNHNLGALGRLGINQAIEVRGGLRFNYAGLPNDRQADLETRVRWLPFYENPRIVETRKARYAKQEVFLRNEPVRLFTGADARKFRVEFHYTLIHMAQMMTNQSLFALFSTGTGKALLEDEMTIIKNYLIHTVAKDTKSSEAEVFRGVREAIRRAPPGEGETSNYEMGVTGRESINTAPAKGISGYSAGNPRGSLLEQRIAAALAGAGQGMSHRDLPWDGPNQAGNWGLPDDETSTWNTLLLYVMNSQGNWEKISRLLQYAVNNIRSAVIGSTTTPVKGPPIVELKWGTMYNFTPCIVTDYRLEPVEDAGYDTKTLMSQRLKVSLTLEEMRGVHGHLWGDPQVTGSLPGWDTIMTLPGGIDPPQDKGFQLKGLPLSTWQKNLFPQS